MKEPLDPSSTARLVKSLDDVDTEIARLALLCKVRILDPGVVERVVRKDASVCGTDNPIAFEKLHNLATMHFLIRDSAGVTHGHAQVFHVEQDVIDRLRKRFPALADEWPSSRP